MGREIKAPVTTGASQKIIPDNYTINTKQHTMLAEIKAAVANGAFRELMNYHQFVPYKIYASKKRPGKMDKIPLDYRTGKTKKKGIDIREIFTDFNKALAVAENFKCCVGFIFTKNDPFFFLDIDNCLEPCGTKWTPLAIELCRIFGNAAVEVSSSGKALHIFGTYKGEVKHKCKNTALNIELYTGNRLGALTGYNARGDINQDCTHALLHCVEKYFNVSSISTNKNMNSTRSSDWNSEPVAGWNGYADNEELIERALKSKSPDSIFGSKASFKDLWEASEEKLSVTYPSNDDRPYDYSSADAGLAQHLAFWTGSNHQRIFELMQQSKLKRDKWEDREDYLPLTIRNACSQQTTWHQKTHHQAIRMADHVSAGASLVPLNENNLSPTNNTPEHFADWPIVKITGISPPPPSYVVTNWLPENVLTLMAGHGSVGKSYLALMEGICISVGAPFLEQKTIQKRVIFLSCEDSAHIIRYRADVICRTLGLNKQEVEKNLLILDAAESPTLYEETGKKAGITIGYEKLRSYIKSFNAEVVIIDNASETFDANETIRPFVRGFLRSLIKLKTTVLLLAHVNKETGKGKTGSENYSGSTAWHNSCRFRLFLEDNRDGTVVLHNEKSNYGRITDSITLERTQDGVLVCKHTNPSQNEAQDQIARISLLALINKLYKQDEFISPAKNTKERVFKILKDDPLFPKPINTNSKMQTLLENAEARGELTREKYKNNHYKESTRWKLTAIGLEAIEIIASPTATTAETASKGII